MRGVQGELFHPGVFLVHFLEDCQVHWVLQVPVLTWETLDHQVPFHSWGDPLTLAQVHLVPLTLAQVHLDPLTLVQVH